MHLARVLRIVGHLKKTHNLEIVCEITEKHQTNDDRTANRREMMVCCPDSAEEIDSVLLIPKHKSLLMSTCCNSDISHDRVTRRSIGGVAGIVRKTIVIHKSTI